MREGADSMTRPFGGPAGASLRRNKKGRSDLLLAPLATAALPELFPSTMGTATSCRAYGHLEVLRLLKQTGKVPPLSLLALNSQ
jgi:hypothetical protein